jgi:hypothetical protein
MPAIKLIGFTGETPRIVPRLRAPTLPSQAIDRRVLEGIAKETSPPRCVRWPSGLESGSG